MHKTPTPALKCDGWGMHPFDCTPITEPDPPFDGVFTGPGLTLDPAVREWAEALR
jgi:hypothetical protein